MNSKSYIPWVEKYRPTDFNNIVLDKNNRTIFNNIIEQLYFPNLLIYGPPGTGKTTTIINLINLFQKKTGQLNSGLTIHLNASDDRGIDIIRNQINNFVNSKVMFNNGTKFIILDEVDYITRNAQTALKYLLQEYRNNVRFCLICNYISKIDESLQEEFVRLKFNILPKTDIINFLNEININEKLNLTITQLESIQNIFKSDMRSMINYIQSNQLAIYNTNVITNNIFDKISKLLDGTSKNFYNKLYNISTLYNIDIKNLIKIYLNYIIRSNSNIINITTLNKIEYILHNSDINLEYQIKYLFYILQSSDK